jgi:putative methyltransferase (TIGR04325 family)
MSAHGVRWQVQRAVWALTPPALLPLVRSLARRLGLATAPTVALAQAEPAAPMPAETPLPHWEHVPEGFAREAKGWNVQAISDAYREKWPSYLAAIEGSKPLGVNHEVPSGQAVGFEDHGAHNMLVSYAYVLALAARTRDRISLLDWGGGIGHYLPLSRALVPDVEIDYHCKDVSVLAEHGRELFPEASFYDDDSCLQRRYDLVLVSASLQYAPDWKATLAALARATDGLLYVARAPIAMRSASFVVLQRAYDYGYDTEYLGWVFNRDELLAVARESGGELVREFLFSAWLSAAGAPEAPIGHRGFLFARRPTGIESNTSAD